MKTKYVFVVLFTVSVLCAGCGGSNKSAAYTYISPGEFQTLMADSDVVVIDVQIPEEKHIAGTDKFIPYNEILDHPEKLPQDKNTILALYCLSGPMSEKAASTLSGQGYKKIFLLRGGALAWKQKGLPMEE